MVLKKQSIHLRPANAVFVEGLQFACYLDQAAEGFFRAMLGRDSENIIASAFLDSGHSLSHEHVIFAEDDETIVGMISSFSEKQHRSFSNEPLRRAAKRSSFRLTLMQTLFAPVWRILETIPEGHTYVQGIAINPALRGAGIGSLLVGEVERRAIASGSTTLSLDVSAKNEGAMRLYKRLGMTRYSSWPSAKLLPTFLIRMAKQL